MPLTELKDGRLEFVAHGLTFKQNAASPELFAFVASSNVLVRFCGVARKSEHFLTNYQRALDTDRVKNEIAPFFKVPENCSPTAIVISLQETPTCKVTFGATELPAVDPGVSIRELRLQFADPQSMTPETLIVEAKRFLDYRLQADPQLTTVEHQDAEGEDGDVAGSEETVAEAVAADAEEDEDDTLEIGTSMLRELRTLLDGPDQLSEAVLQTLREMLKPALVIDGQHRLFGAAEVEDDIPILCCCLVDPDWKEQVFQFIVVNDKATGIPKPFITSLAGMSLTAGELDTLRTRLSQAKVRLWEVEVMQRLGYDLVSPFYQLIEFKVSDKSVRGLGYQTMKRVGQAWYHPKSSGLYKLMNAVYAGGDAKRSKKALREFWQTSGDWFLFFATFWNEVKARFDDTPTWQLHSNLLTAVVLEAFQAVFLKRLDAQGALMWQLSGDTVEERRKEMLARLKPLIQEFVNQFDRKHFERQWKMKSLNHREGRRALEDLFRRIAEGESTANHPVVTGVST